MSASIWHQYCGNNFKVFSNKGDGMFRVSAIVGILLAVCICPIEATTIYVPSQQSTIQGAMYLANNGDTILVAPGTYSEHFSYLGKNVVLKSQNGPETTIIQAANANRPIVRFQSGEPCTATLEGFTVRNAHDSSAVMISGSGATLKGNIFTNNSSINDGGVVTAINGDTLYVLNNIFRSNLNSGYSSWAGGLYTYTTPVIVSGNEFRNNTAAGAGAAFLRYTGYAVVDHNLIVGNAVPAENAGAIYLEYCTGGAFYNNTVARDTAMVAGTWASAVTLSECANISIYNNIIANNVGKGIWVAYSTGCQATYNNVWGNSTNYEGITPGAGSISVDPLFFGGSPYSYTLAYGSPCINAGDPASPTDPDESVADIGVYYFGHNLGSISGTVLDSLASPFAEVEVTALNTVYKDTTDESGYYLIGGLLCDRTYSVKFTHDGYVDSTLTGITVAPNETTHIASLQLRIFEYGWVEGTVYDSASFPISGVAVVAQGTSYLDTTDAAGYFMLPLIPSGLSYNILLSRGGYFDSTFSAVYVTRLDTVELGNIIYHRDPSEWYVLGDVNGDGDAMPLSDVVIGYNFLRGGTGVPFMHCNGYLTDPGGDVSGTCGFNGIDIIDLCQFWEGVRALNPCPNCATPVSDRLLPPSALDPGLPDTVFLGYPNGSHVKAEPYFGAVIPIFIKNDEPIAGAHIAFAADTSEFRYMGINHLEITFPPLFSSWPNWGYIAPELNQPGPGQISGSFLGWKSNATVIPCINTDGAYQLIGYFSTNWSRDDGRIGSTYDIFAGSNSRIGATAFCDSAGLNEWGPVVMPGQVDIVSGRPRISVSPAVITDTLPPNGNKTVKLFISSIGEADLWYYISPYPSWTSFNHICRVVQVSRIDTVVVTLNAAGLPNGLNSDIIQVASFDTSNDSAVLIPVNLMVGSSGIHGQAFNTDGLTPLPEVRVMTYDAGNNVVDDRVADAQGVWNVILPAGTYHEHVTRSGFISVDINNIVVAEDGFTGVTANLAIEIGGCHYVPGDVNGPGTFTGLDITYMVRFFKGGPHPTYSCECTTGNTWYVSGDVNGSCSFTGLDITYSVRYFKGGPAPIPCPDCPPAAR
jgi:parallel beta-helix repeat protein